MDLNRTFIILQERVDELNSLIAKTKEAMTAFANTPNGETAHAVSSATYELQRVFRLFNEGAEKSLEDVRSLERSAIALSSILRWNDQENKSSEE